MSPHDVPLADREDRARAVEDHGTTFLVEAAAGTGKTTILVGRILALLESGAATLPEIAAITFTEKAAGELKQRLRMELEARLRAAESAEARTRGAEALRDLDRMAVTTIHGFAGDLLRERPVEAGVSPEFGILDADGRKELLDEVWEQWVAEETARENPALGEALRRGIAFEGGGRGPARSVTIRTLADGLLERRDAFRPPAPTGEGAEPAADLRAALEAASIPDRLAALRAEVRRLLGLRAECADPADTLAVRLAEFDAWRAEEPDPGTEPGPAAYARWLERMPRTACGNRGKKGTWTLDLPTLRAEIAAFGEQAAEVLRALDDALFRALFAWLGGFVRRVQAEKAARGVLDFDDLLLAARDMLRDSRPARAWFKARIRRLLIDEFQDTDPKQAEIAFYLAEVGGAHEPDWTRVRLAPGRLFLVGDPKQSIYRFRGADLDLYGRVRGLVEGQGEVLRISVNFRSVPAVLEEANRLVAPLMQGPVEGRYEPEYVPLEPHRAPTGDGPAVHCLYPDPETVFAPGGEEQAGGKASPPMGLLREREAAVLARWIRTAVESGLPVRDRQGGGVRGARYRDVGLLLHAMTNVTMIEDALTAEGIPFRVASGKHYYARDEIGDLLLVLRAIDAPYAPEWVAGALRTPFFGCSDEDLARHASAGGVFLAGEAARSPVAAVREGLEFLHDLHAARARLAPAQVIERLLGGTQAHALYRAKPHGEQRLANLLRVRAFARERAGGPAGTFRSFVDWLARRQAEAVDEGEAPASEPGDDVVQCLTMHRAKGLEFPVVVLAQLGQSRERTDLPPLLDGPRARPAVHVRKGCESLGYPEAQAAHAAREEHENRRLLYVALTRARDHLVLPLHWTSSPDIGVNGYFLEAHPPRDAAEEREEPAGVRGVLLAPPEGPEAPDARAEAVSGVGGVPGAGVAEGDGEGAGDGPLASRRAWEAAHAARAGRLNAGRPVRTASDALEAAARAGAESASDAEPDAAADAEPDRPALRAHEPESPDAARAVETARRFGTLVHALLEEADLPDGTTLEPLSRRLAAESGSDEAERAEALALARSALGTPLLRRAAAAEALAREAPFAAEADGTLLEGFVDLVFLEAGGAVVVDYKTNRVTAAETAAAAERYRPQAAVYARALAEALPVPVREVVFLFLRPGVAESIPVDAALLSEAAAAGPAGAGASL